MTSIIYHEQRILACVDQSRFAEYVTDYAAWSSRGSGLPLELLHILERHQEVGLGDDHSGTIGIESRDALLETLVEREAAESKLTRERGRIFLSGLRDRAMRHGVPDPSIRQRHGELEQTLVEQETSVELFVLGRRGESAESTGRDLGRNLERVVRALHRPILAVSEAFRLPKRAMIAFDGSPPTRRGVEMICVSALLKPLAYDVVMAGEPGRRGADQLEWARAKMAAAGIDVTAMMLPGDPEREIARALRERETDLLVMGAYSHSVLRRIFRGSRTADLLRASRVPTLLLR